MTRALPVAIPAVRGAWRWPRRQPIFAWSRGGDVLSGEHLETSQATLELGGRKVTVEQKSEFPAPRSCGHHGCERPLRLTFAVKIRLPAWAAPAEIRVAGVKQKADSAGWIVLPSRAWKSGDQITVDFHLGPRLIRGEYGNAGRAALAWGPFVLAFDQQNNPGLPPSKTLGLVESQPLLTLRPGPSLAFEAKVSAERKGSANGDLCALCRRGGRRRRVSRLAAGAGVATKQSASLLADGEESRSRQGNLSGSIIDDDLQSVVVTFDNHPAREDW